MSNSFFQGVYKLLVAFSLYFIVKWIFEYGGNQAVIFVKFLIVIAAINTFLGFLLFYYGINFQTSSNVIGLDEASGRIAGMRGENYTGYWSAPLFSGILYQAFRKNIQIQYRIFFMTVALVGIISIILGLSRTGIISIILIFLFTQYNSFHRSTNKLSRFILLAVFTITTAIIADMFIDKLISSVLDQNIINEQTLRLHSDNRSYIWVSWLTTALDNPAGIGPGAILEKLNSHYGVVPHNSFLDIFVEYGFMGLVIMIIILTHVFRNFNLKSNDFTLVTLMGAFLGMLTSLFFLSNPFLPLHFIIAGGIVGRNRWLIQNGEHE
jgi:O-antigen ligase